MILVTGGTGMIGAHTARALADAGQPVVVTTHTRPDAPPFLAGRAAVEQVDVADRDALLDLGSRHAISDIVHLAGSIPAADDPVGYFRRDIAALLNALDAARAWGVRRFAVASSLGVYAGRPETPWTQDLDLPCVAAPHLIVAFKKAVEPLTIDALAGSGVSPVLLRIGTIWGPLVDPESPFFHVPRVVSALLRGEVPPPLHAEDGGDICYAADAGRAIAALITAPRLQHDVSNVSSGEPFANRQFAEAVRGAVPGARLDVRDGRSAGPGPDPYLDITRLTVDTGYRPAFDLASAVADYVEWRAEHSR